MLHKKLIYTIFLFSHALHTASWYEWLYQTPHAACKALLYLTPYIVPFGTATELGAASGYGEDIKEEYTKNFLRKKLSENGIKPKTIKLKVIPPSSAPLATGKSMLMIDENFSKELNEKLQKNQHDVSERCSTLIDHEIGRLKHNDMEPSTVLGFSLGVGILQYIALRACIKYTALKKYLIQPKTFGQSLKNCAVLLCFHSLVLNQISSLLGSAYTRIQKRKADVYACKQAKTPQELYAFAKYLAHVESEKLAILTPGQQKFCWSDLWYYPSSTVALFILGKLLRYQYIAEKTEKPFGEWLVNQRPYAYELAAYLLDPDQPLAQSRISEINKAAEALEHQQAAKQNQHPSFTLHQSPRIT